MMTQTLSESREAAIGAIAEVLSKNGLVSDRTPAEIHRLAEFCCNGIMGAGVVPVAAADALLLRDRGLVPPPASLRALVSDGLAQAYNDLIGVDGGKTVEAVMLHHCVEREAFVDVVASEIERAAKAASA